jgi:hypothetical protein
MGEFFFVFSMLLFFEGFMEFKGGGFLITFNDIHLD